MEGVLVYQCKGKNGRMCLWLIALGCLGKVVHKGEKINNHAPRNPFNAAPNQRRDVYIQIFNYKEFPECLNKKITD